MDSENKMQYDAHKCIDDVSAVFNYCTKLENRIKYLQNILDTDGNKKYLCDRVAGLEKENEYLRSQLEKVSEVISDYNYYCFDEENYD